MQQDTVYIRTPDRIHNNYGLEFWTSDDNPDPYSSDIALFRDKCLNAFVDELSQFEYFDQGRSLRWQYYEFWCYMTPERHDVLLNFAEQLAKQLGVSVDIK